jgi:hypothetical protein
VCFLFVLLNEHVGFFAVQCMLLQCYLRSAGRLLQLKVECIAVLARGLQTSLTSRSRKLLILFPDEAYLTIASSLNPKILFSLLTHWYDVILCERLASHFKTLGHMKSILSYNTGNGSIGTANMAFGAIREMIPWLECWEMAFSHRSCSCN